MMTFPNNNGFTLVELMIALTISGIVMASVYTAYITQQKSSIVQEQVVEMQQNIRAAINMMTMEIQMAGYDPTKNAATGIVQATAGRLHFTFDDNGEGGDGIDNDSDGEIDEQDEKGNITFGFSSSASNPFDLDEDGVADSGAASLGRESGGNGFQPIADDIVAIEFCYRLEGDGENDPCTTTPSSNQLDQIREVRISILARASKPDRKFTNNIDYYPASCLQPGLPSPVDDSCVTGKPWDFNGDTAGNSFNDNYRRRLLITTVQCRNMGLK